MKKHLVTATLRFVVAFALIVASLTSFSRIPHTSMRSLKTIPQEAQWKRLPGLKYLGQMEYDLKAKQWNAAIALFEKCKKSKRKSVRQLIVFFMEPEVSEAYEKLGQYNKEMRVLYTAFHQKNAGIGDAKLISHYALLCEAFGNLREAKWAYVHIDKTERPDAPIIPDVTLFETPAQYGTKLDKKLRLDFKTGRCIGFAPLAIPQIANPTFDEAKACAFEKTAREYESGSTWAPVLDRLRIAAELMPRNPSILWHYATILHRYSQDRSAFLEYNLAEKYSSGKVKKAIEELRKSDRLGVRIPLYSTSFKNGKFVTTANWITRTANDFKDLPMQYCSLSKALGLPEKVAGPGTGRP